MACRASNPMLDCERIMLVSRRVHARVWDAIILCKPRSTGRRLRKGATEAITQFVKDAGGGVPGALSEISDRISSVKLSRWEDLSRTDWFVERLLVWRLPIPAACLSGTSR